jgi:hypothetical protein
VDQAHDEPILLSSSRFREQHDTAQKKGRTRVTLKFPACPTPRSRRSSQFSRPITVETHLCCHPLGALGCSLRQRHLHVPKVGSRFIVRSGHAVRIPVNHKKVERASIYTRIFFNQYIHFTQIIVLIKVELHAVKSGCSSPRQSVHEFNFFLLFAFCSYALNP